MPIINVLVTIVVIGLIVWAVNSFIPMAEPYKKIFNIVAIVLTCIWLLSVFGILTGMSTYRVGPH
jgi:hypothetical protein